MQVFSNNRIVSHFPKAPPPSAAANSARAACEPSSSKPTTSSAAANPNFRSENSLPSSGAFPHGNPNALKKRRRISGKSFPARENPNAPPKEKFAPPEPSANFKPRAKTSANGLRGSLPAILPTAPGYAFGLFPKRRRLSWRTGGWRNILRRARRAPRKRGRPFAG